MVLIQNGFHSDNSHLVSYRQDSLEVSTQKHTGPHAMWQLLLFNFTNIGKYEESSRYQ